MVDNKQPEMTQKELRKELQFLKRYSVTPENLSNAGTGISRKSP